MNLLSNAIKYSNDKGVIHVEVKSHEPSEALLNFSDKPEYRFMEIKVIDHGEGILAKELPYIFDKFYQAKSISGKQKSGTGIGLSLTKGLVQLHHGKI